MYIDNTYCKEGVEFLLKYLKLEDILQYSYLLINLVDFSLIVMRNGRESGELTTHVNCTMHISRVYAMFVCKESLVKHTFKN